MPARLYATAEDTTTSENSLNPSLCAENKLNLLPEHLAQIGAAFIFQLSKSSLAPRDFRILTSIYNQTIGYDKREDDMNGVRLEQLTGVRRDHANESVLRLESFGIILTHRGKYGKWMSINFDFPNWGKALSESTTNDPSCLLSDIYQSLLPLENEFAEFKLYIPTESRKKEPTVTVIKEESSAVLLQPASPAKPTPLAPAKPTPPTTAKPKPASIELDFPDSFSEKLRQLISHHLASFKIPAQAQRLLDYFVKCLQNGKIYNPIAYFIGLKKRWLAGTLDLNDNEQASASATTTEDKAQQQNKTEQNSASPIKAPLLILNN